MPITFKKRRPGLGDDLTDVIDTSSTDTTGSTYFDTGPINPTTSASLADQAISAYDATNLYQGGGTGVLATADSVILDGNTQNGVSAAEVSAVGTTVVQTSNASDTSTMDAIIKALPALANGLAQYQKVSLPGGGAIYQRINPATGQPYATSTMLSSSQVGAWVQANPMIALGGIALVAYLMMGKKSRRGRED